LTKKVILHIISGLSSGGAEGVLYRLIKNDINSVHKVVSLTDGGVYVKKLINIGVIVDILNMPRGRVTIRGINKLYKIIKATSPDIVQTWMYHSDLLGGVLAKILSVKIIIWGIRGPYNKKITSFSTKLVVYSCMLLSRWIPTFIISNSYFSKDAHINIGYPEKGIKVIHNGYTLNSIAHYRQRKDCSYKKYQIKHNSFVFGMVSRYDPHKDHENLFRALEVLKSRGLNFVCLLVGSGMIEENVELYSLMERYNLAENIRLLGCLDNIPEIMSILDVHVLSSMAESFPNVLAEAMIMKTPCVSTDAGDSKIIIADTGWVVPVQNHTQLADVMEDAILKMKNKTEWNERQLACRERIKENYSLERMISSYYDIWRGAVDE
jgi:glycosyltransferase involved in cell wall biosynthesis